MKLNKNAPQYSGIKRFGKFFLLFLGFILSIFSILFFVSLYNYNDFPPITPPRASIDAIEAGNGFVKIYHRGGDNLDLNNVKIVIDHDNMEIIYEKASSNNDIFQAGDILNLSSEGITLNDNNTIYPGRLVRNSASGTTKGQISITLTDISSNQVIDVARINGNGINITG